MAEPVTSYIIENDEDFKKALDRLAKPLMILEYRSDL